MAQGSAMRYRVKRTYNNHAYRFMQKLGCKPNDRLHFLLIRDDKKTPRRFSASADVPAMPLHKPFHSLERLVPRMTLFSKKNKLINALVKNRKGYAVFMEINARETTKGPFQAIRAQFIDVDLNKVAFTAQAKEHIQQHLKTIMADPSEQFQSIEITQIKNGQYRLLAQRTAQRVAALKKQFMNKHRSSLKDTMIIETKNGFHVYWVIQGGSIEKFVPIQKALARKFSSDPLITNLSRVMRIPGFYHMKNADSPYLVRVKQWGREKPFTQEEIVESLGLKPVLASEKGRKRKVRARRR
ncbi:DNA-primase RepB domain-containing protein [Paenibacillus sp. NEAU-GSW1]|uniref:DNA-primase RepB domain-containing protein n=1 Tax=Paenibacillus sp. NEAU-GSW1 TaxID=2682486 RepID=UPI0015641348|nr:DNA-primase RepB domain-containing protein [Paenibacillus sp. NEAU-GSW1]